MRILALLVAVALAACSPPEDLRQQAAILQAQERYEESIEPLVALVNRGERDSELMFRYGLALSMTGRESQAMWPLEEARKDSEWFTRASMRLAADAFRGGNYDVAIGYASEVLEEDPEHIDALKLRTFARLQSRRDYEGALEDVERAQELSPESRDLDGPRIVALLGLERIDEAGEALAAWEERQAAASEVGAAEGNPALACAARAKFAQEKGDREAAGETLEYCLTTYPADHTVVNESIDFFREDDPSKVDEILVAAHEAAPTDRAFRVALARRLQLLGKEEEAEAVLRAATEISGVDAWMDLAGYLAETGRIDDGIEAYETALAASPHPHPDLRFTYAETLINAGRLDDAWAASEAMGVPSHRAFVQGRIHFNREEYAEALAAFTEGVKLWPDSAIARYYTARAAEAIGDFERATEEYRYAMRVDPNAADTRIRLARLHLASGHPGDSLYVLRSQGLGPDPPVRTVETALLELEATALLGELDKTPKDLYAVVDQPAHWGRAIAAVASGTRRRLGPAAAVQIVRGADRLNIAHPTSTAALRGLVGDLGVLGEHEAAVDLVQGILETEGLAVYAEILGEALAAAERAEEAKAAFEQALELEPGRPHAVMGLARLLAARQQQAEALALFDAVELDGLEDSAPVRTHAELLAAAGRSQEARNRLRDALEADPYDGDLALALAKLQLASGAEAEARRYLEQAALFGGGAEARELIASLAPAES